MGGSLSRSPKQKSKKKVEMDGSIDRPKKTPKAVKSKKKDEQPGQAERTGQETLDMERKDSKIFWISHVSKRTNSQDDIKAQTLVDSKAISKPTGELSPLEGKHSGKHNTVVSGLKKNNKGKNSNGANSNGYLSEKKCNSVVLNGSHVFGEEKQDLEDSNSSVVPQSPGLLPGQTSGSIDASHLISVNELYNYFWDGGLNCSIFDPSYMLLVDARPRSEYERGHIILAHCAASLYNDLLTSSTFGYGYMASSGEQAIANSLSEYTHLIVYGNPVLDTKSGDLPEIKLMRELMNYELVEPMLLASGYDCFNQTWPFMCTAKELTIRHDHKEITPYPSLILENQLYLGRGVQATNEKILLDLKLTHVVNIGSEHPSPFTDHIQYLNIKLDDSPSSDLKLYFTKAYHFIDDALSTGGCILVHCNLGVSRSSTVVIAYLMKSREWSLKMAYDFVKDRRHCIQPNRGFLRQLGDWEKSVLGHKETDPDDLWF